MPDYLTHDELKARVERAKLELTRYWAGEKRCGTFPVVVNDFVDLLNMLDNILSALSTNVVRKGKPDA